MNCFLFTNQYVSLDLRRFATQSPATEYRISYYTIFSFYFLLFYIALYSKCVVSVVSVFFNIYFFIKQ